MVRTKFGCREPLKKMGLGTWHLMRLWDSRDGEPADCRPLGLAKLGGLVAAKE